MLIQWNFKMIQFVVLILVILNAAYVLGDPYIVGGRDANITEVPYQVLPLMEFSGKFFPNCGGSIISEKVILSAAHCFNPKRATYYVRYGSSYKSKGGIVVKVSNISKHKQFNSITGENDIALLFLEEPIKFNEYAQKIALPNFEDTLEDGTMTTISGWGTTLEGGTNYSEILQKASVPIVNIEKCNKAHSDNMDKIKPGMICAGYLGNEGIDACDGDSGGPLAVNNTLYGITSWGKGCALPMYPRVFTEISYFRNWIDSELKVHNV